MESTPRAARLALVLSLVPALVRGAEASRPAPQPQAAAETLHSRLEQCGPTLLRLHLVCLGAERKMAQAGRVDPGTCAAAVDLGRLACHRGQWDEALLAKDPDVQLAASAGNFSEVVERACFLKASGTPYAADAGREDRVRCSALARLALADTFARYGSRIRSEPSTEIQPATRVVPARGDAAIPGRVLAPARSGE